MGTEEDPDVDDYDENEVAILIVKVIGIAICGCNGFLLLCCLLIQIHKCIK